MPPVPDEQLRHGDEQTDRSEVLDHVEWQLGVDVRIDCERTGRGNDERVAIGGRLGDVIDADNAVGAATVVDHHRVVHPLVELLRQRPRHDVDRSARGIRHDDADRLARKSLSRAGRRALCEYETADTGQSQRDDNGAYRIHITSLVIGKVGLNKVSSTSAPLSNARMARADITRRNWEASYAGSRLLIFVVCSGFHACHTPYPASLNAIASSTSISRAAS